MNVLKYLKEAQEEFNKITWPTRKETINYSLVVVIISVLLAVFIGLSDYILNLGVEAVIDTDTSSQTLEAPAIDFNDNAIQIETQPVEEATQ
jgi:preprotein translocase subunit SecE